MVHSRAMTGASDFDGFADYLLTTQARILKVTEGQLSLVSAKGMGNPPVTLNTSSSLTNP